MYSPVETSYTYHLNSSLTKSDLFYHLYHNFPRLLAEYEVVEGGFNITFMESDVMNCEMILDSLVDLDQRLTKYNEES